MNKEQLLDDLYEVLQLTENEAAYELIGNTIDYIKKEVR
ncbi:nucleoid DNA-binding protein [Neobacillus sp. B4I6]